MKKLRITSQAQTDLDAIWQFIADDNPIAADNFHDLLFSKISLILQHPKIGRKRDELRENLRGFPVGSYIIFYSNSPEYVDIIRILHGARDIENIL
jgi:toxin ParE1/3/4